MGTQRRRRRTVEAHSWATGNGIILSPRFADRSSCHRCRHKHIQSKFETTGLFQSQKLFKGICGASAKADMAKQVASHQETPHFRLMLVDLSERESKSH